jgi:hypothetical protein
MVMNHEELWCHTGHSDWSTGREANEAFHLFIEWETDLFFSKASRLALGPTQYIVQRVKGGTCTVCKGAVGWSRPLNPIQCQAYE